MMAEESPGVGWNLGKLVFNPGMNYPSGYHRDASENPSILRVHVFTVRFPADLHQFGSSHRGCHCLPEERWSRMAFSGSSFLRNSFLSILLICRPDNLHRRREGGMLVVSRRLNPVSGDQPWTAHCTRVECVMPNWSCHPDASAPIVGESSKTVTRIAFDFYAVTFPSVSE